MTTWSTTQTTIVPGATCPDGTTGGITVFDNTVNAAHRIFLSPGNNQGAGFYNYAISAKPDPTHGLGYVLMKIGTNAEQEIFDVAHGVFALNNSSYGQAAAPTAINIVPEALGFYRLSFTINDATGIGFVMLYIADTYADVQGTYAGGTPSSGVVFCNPMVQPSHAEDTRRYVINDAGSGIVTRAADLFSVANPLDGGPLVLAATVLVDNARYDSFIERGIIGFGLDAGNDSNSARWFISSTGFLTWVVDDANGAQDTWTANTITWPGRRHLRLQDLSGAVTMYQDGALDGGLIQLATTHSGAGGNGYISTPPSTVFIGSEGSYGNQFGGVLQDICANNDTGSGCAYQFTKHHTTPLYTPKTLLALGDSLTRNTLANSNYWPNMLALDRPDWTVNNWGEPSYTIAQIDIKYSDAGWYAKPQQLTTLEEGINDSVSQFYTDASEQFWVKQLWDKVLASGSELVVVLESPWAHSVSWSAGEQTHYDTNQAWKTAEAALYGLPGYIDEYKCTTPAHAGVCLWDAGTSPPVITCGNDYDTDGTTVIPCAGGVNQPNWVHINDAGQGIVESDVRGVLGL